MTLFNKKTLVALFYLALISTNCAAFDSTSLSPPTTYRNMNRNIVVDPTNTAQCVQVSKKIQYTAQDHSGGTDTQTVSCAAGYFPVELSSRLSGDGYYTVNASYALDQIGLKNTVTCCKMSYQWQ